MKHPSLILLAALIGAATALAAASAAPAPPPIIVIGAPEPVFDWSHHACEPNDFADSPARAFRTGEGLRLFASHFAARPMSGRDGDHLIHRCAVAFQGEKSADPAEYSDLSWLVSPYALGGGRVFAVVHNEFQGHRHPGTCAAGQYRPCWENSITWAMSEDDGASFEAPPADRRMIAAPPWRYDGGRDRPGGYFNPSNIVAFDGGWYALAWARPYRAQKGGACVLRTTRLDDPAAWRAWDGKGFNARFADPYRERVDDPAAHVCTPVGTNAFRDAPSSLVRDEASGLFLALQAVNMPDPNGGPAVAGVWLSASRDLIAWSAPRLVWQVAVWEPRDCGGADWSIAYPSLIDFDSETLNLETVEGEAWLYFTRYGLTDCRIGKDRSLWRVRVSVGSAEG